MDIYLLIANLRFNTLIIFLCTIIFCSKVVYSESLINIADEEYGAYLAGECLTCHQSKSVTGIPSIVGKDFNSLILMLNAYKNKDLDSKVMQLVAGKLNDEQIASLALYFSNLSPIK
tara:strand:- start:9 stop:359 length:351 start_codon:yes stop_codon:yes gene_type:complete